jgi:nucleolar GTP-binding protein
LCSPRHRYIRSFPNPKRLHPFEEALLDLTVGAETYLALLARVDVLRKSITALGKQLASRAARAGSRKEAADVAEQGMVEMERLFSKGCQVGCAAVLV